MNRFQDRRMVKRSGGEGAILVFEGEEGFAFKQAKFGDDFPPYKLEFWWQFYIDIDIGI